jgi:hypothetical protein
MQLEKPNHDCADPHIVYNPGSFSRTYLAHNLPVSLPDWCLAL